MKKIHIAFLLIHNSELLRDTSLKTIFNAAVSDPTCQVSVLSESFDPNAKKRLEDYLISIGEKPDAAKHYQCCDVNNRLTLDVRRLSIDVIFTVNPYERKITFTINEMCHKLKVCYVNYGIEMDKSSGEVGYVRSLKNAFRFFYTSEDERDIYQINFGLENNHKFIKSGSPKFDFILDREKIRQKGEKIWSSGLNSGRKKIIITSHHQDKLAPWSNGNFIEHHKFFLQLPKKYPEIDFIMRFHPNLFPSLKNFHSWDDAMIDEWKKDFCSNRNARIYDGDYEPLFLTSDAMITSALSFVALYPLTKKPFLFITKKDGSHFNSFGKKLISSNYKGRSEQDIINFIENVVIKGNDELYEKRAQVVKEIIPIAEGGNGNFIKNYIKEEILKERQKSQMNACLVRETLRKV
jgi:hypothetical protein